MSAAAKILDRLSKVTKTGEGRWKACCPAHEDKSPSLSICELDDGRVLLHDFGGCGTDAVLAALGLSFTDLFDGPLAHHLPPIKSGRSAREILDLTAHEIMVASILVNDAMKRQLTGAEVTRLAIAAARLQEARA